MGGRAPEPDGRVTVGRLAPVLGLVTVLFGLLLWQLRAVTLASEWVDHTDQVLSRIHEIQTVIYALETGLRGYVITRQASFLTPYETGRRTIGPSLDELDELVRDNPAQVERLGRARTDVADWLAHARTVRDMRQRGEDPAPAIASGYGKSRVDAIQNVLRQMAAEEERLRTTRSRTTDRQTYATVLVAAVAFLVLGAWLALLIGQHRRWQRSLLQGEAALRETEARWHALFDGASEGIFVADLEGRYTDVNPAGCQMLGYSRDELVGKRIVDLIPPDDVPRLQRDREILMSPGLVQVAEWRLRHRNGRFVPVEVSAKILPDGRWQAFARDITERKQAELERQFLLDAGNALASVLDYDETVEVVARLLVREFADLCVIDAIDDDGVLRRARVLARDPAHRATAARLGTLPLDPAGPRVTARALETREPALVPTVDSAFLRSIAQSEEQLRLIESFRPVSVLSLPLVAHGRLVGALALVSTNPARHYDPTDLRFGRLIAARAALAMDNARLYRATRRAVAARDEVLGVVAHDLRNPLSIVGLQLDVLRRRGGDVRRPVDVMGRATARMNRIIEDLLDLARLESGHFTVAHDRLAPAAVLAEAVAAQRDAADGASVGLHLDARADLPDVWADRSRLLQILENLLGNAVKFTPAGGQATAGAASRDGEVLFWVADTGRGIAPEQLPHLFDRFWQATPGERRGVGLGLAIAKGIVEAHGGRIWAESTPGKGSVFFFTLPRADRVEATRSPNA